MPGGSMAGGGRWPMLGIVLLVQVVISAVTQGIPTLAPWIRADLNLSLSEVALFGAAINLGSLVCIAAAGWAVDTYGEKAIQVGGSLVVGLAAAVFAFAPYGAVAFAPLLVVGLGAAAPTPGGSRTVMSWFPPGERGLAMGLRQTGIPLGGALAAAVAPLLAQAAGWRVAVVAGAAACLALAVASGLAYRRSPLADSRATSAPSDGSGSPRALITRDVALTAAAGGLLPFGHFCLVTYLAIFLQQTRGVPIATGASLLLAAQLAGVAGRVLWGLGSDRFFGSRRRPPLVAAAFLAAGGVLLLGWLPTDVPLGVVATLVAFLGFNAIGWQGNWVALLSELAPPAYQARTVGASLTLTYAGVALGPLLIGILLDTTGSWSAAWSVLGVVLATGAALVLPVRERRARA